MSATVVTIPAQPAPPPAPHKVHWWHQASGFSFHDVLDAINPLQHIPLVGSIYRAVTHDEPGAVATNRERVRAAHVTSWVPIPSLK